MGWKDQWEAMVESQRAFCGMTSEQKDCWRWWSKEYLGKTYQGARPVDRWTGEWIKGTLAQRFMEWWNFSLSLSVETTEDDIIIKSEFTIPDVDATCSYNMSYIKDIPILFDIITPTGNNISDHKEYTYRGGWTEWQLNKKELISQGGYGTYYVFARWQDMTANTTFEIPPSKYYLKTNNISGVYNQYTPDTEIFNAEYLLYDKPNTITISYNITTTANIAPSLSLLTAQDSIIYELPRPIEGKDNNITHIACAKYDNNEYVIIYGRFIIMHQESNIIYGAMINESLIHNTSIYIP